MKLHLILFCILAGASLNFADVQQPLLFTTSIPHASDENAIIHFDAGWGSGKSSSNSASAERRIGIVWRANHRWTLLANAGAGQYDSGTSLTGGAEILFALRNSSRHFLDIGGGIRQERSDTVALLRAVSGWSREKWMIQTGLLFEKAASSDRDAVDLITSVGWLRRITPRFSLGVEVIGQDLEGFWEENEAEGGARLLTGPAVHFSFAAWEAGVAGGYVFRPTYNQAYSGADRPFGAGRMALQFSISRKL